MASEYADADPDDEKLRRAFDDCVSRVRMGAIASEIDKKQNYIDECERVEVERKFSLAKRKCGMDMIVTRLKETTCHSIAMSVLLLNLRRIEKLRAEILWLLIRSLILGFVQ